MDLGAGRERPHRVVVVVLSLNQRETTLRCLAALEKLEGEVPFQTLVWDNGSTDGTAEAIRAAFPGVHVHRHPENLGVASGRNAAAELAMESFDPTHILFLDNDIFVEPGFVGSLLEPFGEDRRLAQTQAKLRLAEEPELLNDGGGCRITFWLGRTRPVGFREVDRGQYDRRTPCVACGGAMMVRADVFRELGGFDPTFDPFGPEDLDFSLRARKAGYRALYVPEAVGYHEVSHTFGAGYTEAYARNKTRHWLAFMRRHASLVQRAAFYALGVPYLLLRMLVREARKGNLGAVKGALEEALARWRAT